MMSKSSSLLALGICALLAAPALAQLAPLPEESAPNPEAAPALTAPAADVAPAPENVPALPVDATAVDATAVDATPVDATPVDATAVDATAAPAAVPAPTEVVPAPLPEAAPLPPPSQTGKAKVNTPPSVYAEGEEGGAKSEAKNPCAIGKLCLGPMVSLGAINALGVGVHARYGDHLGFGMDYQWVPTLTFGDASAGWSLVTAEARWYPFGGAFWMGGGFAYQSFSAAVVGHMNGADVTLRGHLGMPAFKFGLGFMGHDGFVMGIDLDVNLPLGTSHVTFDKLTGPAAAYADAATQAMLQKQIGTVADKGVKMIPLIPQINLIRVGYLF